MNGRAAPTRPASITAVAAVLLLSAFPPVAVAADTYVDDDTGSGSTCSMPQPCATIQLGIGAAGAGDTVFIDGGTYNESIVLSDGKSLIEQDFNAGDGDSQATIDGGVGDAIEVLSGDSAGTIRGFTIRANTTAINLAGPATITANTFDDPVSGFGTFVQLLDGSGTSSILNNTFTDTPGDTDEQTGVDTITSGSPTIAGNDFENLRAAIRVANGAATIAGNTIAGTRAGMNAGFAILLFSDGTPTIVDNDIHSPDPGDVTTGIGIFEVTATLEDTGAALRRNEIYDHRTGVDVRNTTGAVSLNGDAIAGANAGLFALDDAPTDPDEGDVVATNVTIFGSAFADLFVDATDLTLDSSIVEAQVADQNGATCAITFSRGPVTTPGGTGCADFQTTANPQFVNPAANNYHLQAGSPMIDQGNPAAATGTDLDGNPRAMDGNSDCIVRRDIGADEFTPPAPVATITSGPANGATIGDPTPSFAFSTSGPAGCTVRECRVDGGTFTPCSSPRTLAALADGDHAFEVRGRHVGGQTGAPARRSFTVDTDPPETELTKKPKKKSAKRRAKFKFSSDEPGSSFDCKLDRKELAPCSSPFKAKVRRKRHTFEVQATDDAGNVDATPATHSWKVRKKRR